MRPLQGDQVIECIEKKNRKCHQNKCYKKGTSHHEKEKRGAIHFKDRELSKSGSDLANKGKGKTE